MKRKNLKDLFSSQAQKKEKSTNLFSSQARKRGELTTKQLVIIIVLIVSFIIILFLFFRLNLGGTTNKEICRNSVILKSKAGVLAGPLDCRTDYLCISAGKNCENMSFSSKADVKNTKEDIMKTLADEMSDCWWSFGEGKIDYASSSAFAKTACSICSVVNFDEQIQKTSPITYGEFYNYLRTAKKTNTQTYLQYLYGAGSLDAFGADFPIENYLDNKIEFDKSYFILTGMSKEGVLSPRWKFWSTQETPYPVVILEKIPENYNAVGCDDFLTKA